MSTSLVIVCVDSDKTCDFYHKAFQYEQPTKDIKTPFPHASINITKDIQLLIVQKSLCDASLLKSLNSVAVMRVMALVDDPNQIRDNALRAGAETIETISDDVGGIDGSDNFRINVDTVTCLHCL